MSWMMMSFQNNFSFNMMILNKLNNYINMIMMMIMIFIIYMILYISLNKFNNKSLIENNSLEIVWTIIPMIIIILICFPSMKILYLNNEYKNNILTIKIISNQWFWYYEYMNLNKNFNSYFFLNKNFNFNMIETDNSMIVPFNYFIQLIITSMDVIHSWTIPSLNVKLDSIPNQLNNLMLKLNKSGLIFGQCSEICGINHSFMPIKLESISFNKFMEWISLN